MRRLVNPPAKVSLFSAYEIRLGDQPDRWIPYNAARSHKQQGLHSVTLHLVLLKCGNGNREFMSEFQMVWLIKRSLHRQVMCYAPHSFLLEHIIYRAPGPDRSHKENTAEQAFFKQ